MKLSQLIEILDHHLNLNFVSGADPEVLISPTTDVMPVSLDIVQECQVRGTLYILLMNDPGPPVIPEDIQELIDEAKVKRR